MIENIIGIDPGKDGGICCLYSNGDIDLEPMPEDILEMLNYLNGVSKFLAEPTFIFMEKSQPMPGNGVTSMFTYGIHNGELLAALKFSKIPFELVSPQIWTKVMHAGSSADRPKEKSKEVCKRLFPDLSLINPHALRARTAHLGMVDALMIAEFGRRKRNVNA